MAEKSTGKPQRGAASARAGGEKRKAMPSHFDQRSFWRNFRNPCPPSPLRKTLLHHRRVGGKFIGAGHGNSFRQNKQLDMNKAFTKKTDGDDNEDSTQALPHYEIGRASCRERV